MREIRFRVWDKDNNKMIHEAEMASDVSPELTGDIPNFGLFLEYKHRYEVMQYTGLKDKNGVEIYEGDIIKDAYAYSIVRYGHGTYDSGVYSFIGFYLEWDGEQQENTYWDRQANERYEVIGNIYMNEENGWIDTILEAI